MNPSPILSAEKDSISPGDGSSGGDPGPERHPFAVWQIFGRRSKPHPQTILQWEFFLGLGDEKKRKNTCAHKFLFETTKTTSGSSIINTEKNAHLKLIFLPISREAVPLLSTTVFQYWPRPGSLASAVPLTSRPWMPHPKIPEGVPREIDLFLSSSNSATKTKTKNAQNLTSHNHPRVFLPDETLTMTLRKLRLLPGRGHRQARRGGRKPREEVPRPFSSWGAPGFPRRSWHARQAGRALDADRVQGGQREESIAQRVPRISPVGKREELRTRTACRERPAGRDRWATGEFCVGYFFCWIS